MRILSWLYRHRPRRGQSLVEFAFTFPIWFIVVVGGMGIFVYVSDYVSYEHALNSAARLAAIEWAPLNNSYQVTSDAHNQFQSSLDKSLGQSTTNPITLTEFKVWSGPCAPSSSPNSCVFVQAGWQPPSFPFLPHVTFNNSQGYKTEPD